MNSSRVAAGAAALVASGLAAWYTQVSPVGYPTGTTSVISIRGLDTPDNDEEALVLHACVFDQPDPEQCTYRPTSHFKMHELPDEAPPDMRRRWTAVVYTPESRGEVRVAAYFQDPTLVEDLQFSEQSNTITRQTFPKINYVPEPSLLLGLAAGLLMLLGLHKWRGWWMRDPLVEAVNNRYPDLDWYGRFLSPSAVVDDMVESLRSNPEAVQSWLDIENRSDLIQGHHTVGRYIRNHYGLWLEGNPFVDPTDSEGDKHPDAVSMWIIEQVWDRLVAGEVAV